MGALKDASGQVLYLELLTGLLVTQMLHTPRTSSAHRSGLIYEGLVSEKLYSTSYGYTCRTVQLSMRRGKQLKSESVCTALCSCPRLDCAKSRLQSRESQTLPETPHIP